MNDSDDNDLFARQAARKLLDRTWLDGARSIIARHAYRAMGDMEHDQIPDELQQCIDRHRAMEIPPPAGFGTTTCFCDICHIKYTYET